MTIASTIAIAFILVLLVVYSILLLTWFLSLAVATRKPARPMSSRPSAIVQKPAGNRRSLLEAGLKG